jgi:hypothetical protein
MITFTKSESDPVTGDRDRHHRPQKAALGTERVVEQERIGVQRLLLNLGKRE